MLRLREAATRRGVSVAQVVRDAIDAELSQGDADEQIVLARETLGAYRSGRPDLGRNHDAYLAEAFEDWHA